MHAKDDLLVLAEQVRQGDRSAAARLRNNLEPRLVIIVGRALRADCKVMPLTEWIRGQARQVLRLVGRPSGHDQDWLVTQVARRVGEWLVDRLRAGTCSPRLLQETVCA